jgi:predicted Rossmann fold flavoprotein
MEKIYDFAILGGGASGLFALRGLKEKNVIIIEGNKSLGVKLLATGGGKCNFTNLHLSADNFICSNPHFIKSFLAKFGTDDILKIIETHGIPYEERDNGKLFTLSTAGDILNALLSDGQSENHTFLLDCRVEDVKKSTDDESIFVIETTKENIHAKKVIVASGGISYPKLGATNIASKIAKNFGMKVTPLLPALAALRYPKDLADDFATLSGIAITAQIQVGKKTFTDQLLFTHRGFSGPLGLNTSLYINADTDIQINFVPDINIGKLLQEARGSKKTLVNILSEYLPKAVVKVLLKKANVLQTDVDVAQIKNTQIETIAKFFNQYKITITQLDGFDKAEVTRGGVCVDDIFPKTMESRKCAGLYFIGEALDVTGMLGGYNLHWAWASAKMLIDALE